MLREHAVESQQEGKPVMKKVLLIAAAVMALGACKSATVPAYKAAGGINQVGYLSAPEADGRATVVYTGAKGTTKAQVAEYALLRAAELASEGGYEWFAVLNSSSEKVDLAADTDLTDKGSLDGGNATAGSGAEPTDGNFGSNPDVALGPTTGGFGGGDVPYQVMERWTPPQGYQTTLIIQMGSGDEASFPGATSAPKIFPAEETAAGIREKMAG